MAFSEAAEEKAKAAAEAAGSPEPGRIRKARLHFGHSGSWRQAKKAPRSASAPAKAWASAWLCKAASHAMRDMCDVEACRKAKKPADVAPTPGVLQGGGLHRKVLSMFGSFWRSPCVAT